MLAVTDSGRAGPMTVRGERHGIGLSNTRLRLEQLYGRDQSLALEKLAGQGARITVEMPWHSAPTVLSTATPSVA